MARHPQAANSSFLLARLSRPKPWLHLATANNRHGVSTPLSRCSPRSTNTKPEPATRSRTVLDTTTSPPLAIAEGAHRDRCRQRERQQSPQGTHAKQRRARRPGKPDMRQRMAREGQIAHDQEGADGTGDDGDDAARQEGAAHEIVFKHRVDEHRLREARVWRARRCGRSRARRRLVCRKCGTAHRR